MGARVHGVPTTLAVPAPTRAYRGLGTVHRAAVLVARVNEAVALSSFDAPGTGVVVHDSTVLIRSDGRAYDRTRSMHVE